MFLLPLLIVAAAGFGIYALVHHRTQPALGADAPTGVTVHRASFWPITIEGKFALGAIALSVLPVVLVNVIQVPYLGIALLLAALALSGVARFVKHDHSTSVLLALAVSALAVTAALAFLAGEIFIGHD
jgi:hypothetical protein